jgi:hypothetical protein
MLRFKNNIGVMWQWLVGATVVAVTSGVTVVAAVSGVTVVGAKSELRLGRPSVMSHHAALTQGKYEHHHSENN